MTHVIHMDPGGSVPAWLVEGTRREMSVARMAQLLKGPAGPGTPDPGHPVAAFAAPPPAPAPAR